MRKKAILHTVLWVVAVVCFILTVIEFLNWREKPMSVSPWPWVIYGAIGLICILVWFFTREKEEEISITRGS
jgi:NADH:ubiquinone oxidoreductase subunit 6 (subunit J)